LYYNEDDVILPELTKWGQAENMTFNEQYSLRKMKVVVM
jgi:hypothetical protein